MVSQCGLILIIIQKISWFRGMCWLWSQCFYLPRFSMAEPNRESLNPGCNLLRICSINLQKDFVCICIFPHNFLSRFQRYSRYVRLLICGQKLKFVINAMQYLLVMPGELRSANSKAFLSSSTTSVWRESLPPAPCFLANWKMVIRMKIKAYMHIIRTTYLWKQWIDCSLMGPRSPTSFICTSSPPIPLTVPPSVIFDFRILQWLRGTFLSAVSYTAFSPLFLLLPLLQFPSFVLFPPPLILFPPSLVLLVMSPLLLTFPLLLLGSVLHRGVQMLHTARLPLHFNGARLQFKDEEALLHSIFWYLRFAVRF